MNRLTDLPGVMSGLSVTRLDLSGNRLAHIPEVVFTMRSLVSLNLSGNLISEVQPGMFSRLPDLTELQMDDNPVNRDVVNSILVQLQFPALHRRF